MKEKRERARSAQERKGTKLRKKKESKCGKTGGCSENGKIVRERGQTQKGDSMKASE